MVKPNEKLKKILFIMGITGAVYAGMKYLLPLVVPFLVAYLIAAFLYPSASLLSEKTKWSVGNRKLKIPVGIIGGVELLLILSVIGIWSYAGGQRLYKEGKMLLDQLPNWVASLDQWLTGKCYLVEEAFSIKKGCLVLIMRDMLKSSLKTVKDGAMPYLMANSVNLFRGFLRITVLWLVGLVAVMMTLQELETIRNWRDHSYFREEFALIKKRLVLMGNAYIKTQGSILLLTMAICMAGLFLMGNPYYILSGIVIGILDALPILGTGTVFIPWIALCLIRAKWGKALWLLGIYLICYFIRHFMEAGMMGKQVGLSPLMTLISMFVGLKLFGVFGFILGPVGLLITYDLVEFYWDQRQ